MRMFDSHAEVRKRRLVLAIGVLMLAVMSGIIGGMVAHKLDGIGTRAQSGQFAKEIRLSNGGLVFKDKQGKIIAKLDADESGGFLIIYNASEKPAVTMGGSQNGGGLIGLTNGKGIGDILRLTGDEDGASLFLLSTRGKRGIELSTDDDGGTLSINGPTGEPAVVVTTSESQKQVSGKIGIYESIAGKLLWSAPRNDHRPAP